MYPNNGVNPGFLTVIGDVVDTYYPIMGMNVLFNGNRITNGATLKPSVAAEAPTIEFQGRADSLYTLLMTDPDMSSPSDPTMKEYIHWIVTDIPGLGRVEEGKEILPYTMRIPQRGIHRYLIMMYEQFSPLGLVDPPAQRAHFDSKRFSLINDLGSPHAIVYFCAKREPIPRQRRVMDQ